MFIFRNRQNNGEMLKSVGRIYFWIFGSKREKQLTTWYNIRVIVYNFHVYYKDQRQIPDYRVKYEKKKYSFTIHSIVLPRSSKRWLLTSFRFQNHQTSYIFVVSSVVSVSFFVSVTIDIFFSEASLFVFPWIYFPLY